MIADRESHDHYWNFRKYEARAMRYFLDTPYEELKEKGDLGLVWETLAWLHRRALAYLRAEEKGH